MTKHTEPMGCVSMSDSLMGRHSFDIPDKSSDSYLFWRISCASLWLAFFHFLFQRKKLSIFCFNLICLFNFCICVCACVSLYTPHVCKSLKKLEPLDPLELELPNVDAKN